MNPSIHPLSKLNIYHNAFDIEIIIHNLNRHRIYDFYYNYNSTDYNTVNVELVTYI